jgi:hypothetical protein
MQDVYLILLQKDDLNAQYPSRANARLYCLRQRLTAESAENAEKIMKISANSALSVVNFRGETQPPSDTFPPPVSRFQARWRRGRPRPTLRPFGR